jgi:hypothetical protein
MADDENYLKPEIMRNEGEPRTRRPVPTHQDYPDLGVNEHETRSRAPDQTIRVVGYQPHYLAVVEALAPERATMAGIADALGTYVGQVIRFMEGQVEFRHAVLMANQRAQVWWERQLTAQAAAGDMAAIKFAMTNMFPEDYKDRREHNVNVADVLEMELIDFTGYDGDTVDAEYEEVPDES